MEPMLFWMLLLKLVPWLVIGGGLYGLSRTEPGRGLIRRLREGGATEADIAALADELQQLRAELAEVQERLDFTERALVQQRQQLPRARSSDHESPTPPEPVLA